MKQTTSSRVKAESCPNGPQTINKSLALQLFFLATSSVVVDANRQFQFNFNIKTKMKLNKSKSKILKYDKFFIHHDEKKIKIKLYRLG
jgi:hypothetical protein